MRMISMAAAVLALTACYDFKGDKERLGFHTNATLDGVHAWTPAFGMAALATPTVAVGEVLATEEGPKGSPHFESNATLTQRDGKVTVAGQGRAWLRAEVDGVSDIFRVNWKPVDELHFLSPYTLLTGDRDEIETLVVLVGAEVPLGIGLTDRKAHPLGWVPSQMEISGDGLDVGFGEVHTILAKSPGTFVLQASWDGVGEELVVEAIAPEELDALSVEEIETEDGCILLAHGLAGEEEVVGLDGLTWTHTDQTGTVVPCSDGSTKARLEGRWLPIR